MLSDEVPLAADQAMKKMSAAGIGTRLFFWPMHEQPVFRRMGFFHGVRCPVAERIARRGFYLPGGLALDDAQLAKVCDTLRAVIGESAPLSNLSRRPGGPEVVG